MEYLSPDELELILEALHCYKGSPDGRIHAGRLTWIREKFVRCRVERTTIISTAAQ
jgi:hypothetical protein|tara:strand:+ start:739 stop:906 length:168 start_codon:yes stop_codon:yes gene_type:complete